VGNRKQVILEGGFSRRAEQRVPQETPVFLFDGNAVLDCALAELAHDGFFKISNEELSHARERAISDSLRQAWCRIHFRAKARSRPLEAG
jgi:hypothetical protein